MLCGNEKSTKPPHCCELCTLPSACHHAQRHVHRCHFGPCPPCALPCGKPLPCGHQCVAVCHSEPKLPKRPAGQAPWVKLEEMKKIVSPCPPCRQIVSRYYIASQQVQVLLLVFLCLICRACRGQHEVSQFHCFEARDYSCGRVCGRGLPCGNHQCERGCHVVVNPPAPTLVRNLLQLQLIHQ